MPSVSFDSRASANALRDRLGAYLAASDDRRTTTVRLKRSTPDRIVERAQSEAFGSRSGDRESYGKAKLTESERETLQRTTSFDWQSHGFEAMSAKAALQSQGVTEWTDYYSPGEDIDSSLGKLRSAKGGAQQSRAGLGIEGMRTDEADGGNTGRRSRQAERVQAQQIQSAKEPALLEGDGTAIDALREEQLFGDDVFDISFGGSDDFGRPNPSGRDFELLEERHGRRSEHAQSVDEVKAAPVTRDPIEWAQAPGELDFPGIDTVDPEQVHANRSERARTVDEQRSAPIASTVNEWARDPAETDLPGIDSPQGGLQDVSPGVQAGGSGSLDPLTVDDDPIDVEPVDSGGGRERDPLDDLDAAFAGRDELGMDDGPDLNIGPV